MQKDSEQLAAFVGSIVCFYISVLLYSVLVTLIYNFERKLLRHLIRCDETIEHIMMITVASVS